MRNNNICPMCQSKMEIKRIYHRSIGMCYYLRCSNAFCSCSGPIALTELGAASKWLDLVSGCEPRTVFDEPTTVRTNALSGSRTIPDLPLLPGERFPEGEPTSRLKPLAAFSTRTDVDRMLI